MRRPIITAQISCMEYSQQPATWAMLTAAAFLAVSLGLVPQSANADAAEPGLELSSDALSAGLQQGGSHVLASIDNPVATIVAQNAAAMAAASSIVAAIAPDAGFEAASVDPAIVSLGAVLESGTASWYGAAWKGRRTASGARFNPEDMTAASRTLPLGMRVLVTLEGTARSVLVTITDRQGAAQRIIDLSKAAARKLGLLGRGTAQVVLRRA